LSLSAVDHPSMQTFMQNATGATSAISHKCSRRGRTRIRLRIVYWNRARCSRYKALCLLITDRAGHTCLLFFHLLLLLLTSLLRQPRTDRVTSHASSQPAAALSVPLIFHRNVNPCSKSCSLFLFGNSYFYM